MNILLALYFITICLFPSDQYSSELEINYRFYASVLDSDESEEKKVNQVMEAFRHYSKDSSNYLTATLRVSADKSYFETTENLKSKDPMKSYFELILNGIAFSDVDYYYVPPKLVSRRIRNGAIIDINEGNSSKWEITSDTEIVASYLCQSAVGERKIFKKDGSTEIVPFKVWFTTQIPISTGPVGISGLPGLVLKADIGNGTWIAYSISENKPDPSYWKSRPIPGKIIEKEDYMRQFVKHR